MLQERVAVAGEIVPVPFAEVADTFSYIGLH
jgi:hypothetical protein